jgi:hypothetical protein
VRACVCCRYIVAFQTHRDARVTQFCVIIQVCVRPNDCTMSHFTMTVCNDNAANNISLIHTTRRTSTFARRHFWPRYLACSRRSCVLVVFLFVCVTSNMTRMSSCNRPTSSLRGTRVHCYSACHAATRNWTRRHDDCGNRCSMLRMCSKSDLFDIDQRGRVRL